MLLDRIKKRLRANGVTRLSALLSEALDLYHFIVYTAQQCRL